MTRALYRISRLACPAADHPWLDALFAEAEAIDSGRGRLLWLAGAAGLLFDRQARVLATLLSPLSLLLLCASVLCSWLALIEFEGLAPEDDWYGPAAAVLAGLLAAVSISRIKRLNAGTRL
jgi:hypothetical protein